MGWIAERTHLKIERVHGRLDEKLFEKSSKGEKNLKNEKT